MVSFQKQLDMLKNMFWRLIRTSASKLNSQIPWISNPNLLLLMTLRRRWGKTLFALLNCKHQPLLDFKWISLNWGSTTNYLKKLIIQQAPNSVIAISSRNLGMKSFYMNIRTVGNLNVDNFLLLWQGQW